MEKSEGVALKKNKKTIPVEKLFTLVKTKTCTCCVEKVKPDILSVEKKEKCQVCYSSGKNDHFGIEEPSTWIFGKNWDIVPNGLNPPSTKKRRKNYVYFAF